MIIILTRRRRRKTTMEEVEVVVEKKKKKGLVCFLCLASPRLDDLRLSGPSLGQWWGLNSHQKNLCRSQGAFAIHCASNFQEGGGGGVCLTIETLVHTSVSFNTK
ncbi:Pol polyprotein [Plakobranchus ocellatus]|uniref:Pol polyprotein n=1 Tax=Plakobranchus ocellatus TaxID=259542 RepID=A0AAV4A478_9GAST|nr:Pol polyprotein [Plakobranchus ocellatus]